MAIRYFKVQTPVVTTEKETVVLVYDEPRDFFTELRGKVAEQMIDALDMQPKGDKVYIMGTVVGTELHVNKATLTREEMF